MSVHFERSEEKRCHSRASLAGAGIASDKPATAEVSARPFQAREPNDGAGRAHFFVNRTSNAANIADGHLADGNGRDRLELRAMIAHNFWQRCLATEKTVVSKLFKIGFPLTLRRAKYVPAGR